MLRCAHISVVSTLAAVILAPALLTGCVSGPPPVTVVTPPARPVVAAIAAPMVIAPAPAYVPGPYDPYISVALDSDIVYIGGSTYVWTTDAGGHRVRHLMGLGDMRAELMHRRAELHQVMREHGGHLPGREEIARERQEAMHSKVAQHATAARAPVVARSSTASPRAEHATPQKKVKPDHS